MTSRVPWGQTRMAIINWIEEQPAGEEFHYREIANELGLNTTTVSGGVNALVREHNPIIVRGDKTGWYRVTGWRREGHQLVLSGDGQTVQDTSLRLTPREVVQLEDALNASPQPVDWDRISKLRNTTAVEHDTPELMEVIGYLLNGDRLLRHEDGTIWEARPMLPRK